MARDLGMDEVVDHLTLVGDEVDQLRNKAGATWLDFAVTLKFLLWRGRFPRGRHELADDAVDHVAPQVGVGAGELGAYDMTGRTAQRHRARSAATRGSGSGAWPTPRNWPSGWPGTWPSPSAGRTGSERTCSPGAGGS